MGWTMNDITGKTLDEIEADGYFDTPDLKRLSVEDLVEGLDDLNKHPYQIFIGFNDVLNGGLNVGIRRPRSPSISWDFWDEPEPRWRRKLRQFLRGLW